MKKLIPIAILIAIYTIIAFYNLGDMHSPQTTWTGNEGAYAVIDFGFNANVSKIMVLNGAKENKKLLLQSSETSLNDLSYSELMPLEIKSVFKWHETDVNFKARYVKLIVESDIINIVEIGFLDANGELIEIKHNNKANMLYDEQWLVPKQSTYLNSTYFDEIYHARTAYEFVNQMGVYEWTHPPLGKAIIAMGIKAFGMTPFGFRFTGTLFGILMILAVYFFARAIFENENWAFFAAFIFTFDFMHFAQTRISTIDTYVTIFIAIMYCFMYLYYKSSFYRKKSLFWLFMSGLFMGLAIASKWQGMFGAFGLAVIFFYNMLQNYKQTDDIKLFKKTAIKTIVYCFVFFIFVPLLVYCISYIPYLNAKHIVGFKEGILGIIKNQKDMFKYHAYLESEHSFASPWYQWAFNIRPIFYYSKKISETTNQAISSFGNPLVWWGGFIAFIYSLKAIKKGDKAALFLVIAYLSQNIPWAIVSRTTYIYHYFPSVPFIVLMTALMFKDAKKPKAAFCYCVGVLILFIMFYPILSGMNIDISYVNRFLEWFPSWQLI